ncbi:uncharacterized protein [Ptychodera flava]|uniref:uncharacterized protein n=1 Tax=Ptychodera flava TaxID=63121 RepID=UPI00396A4D09
MAETIERITIKVQSTISGYHYFHIRPHVDIQLVVAKEPNNKKDPKAMSVLMPTLDDIPGYLHETITREADKRNPKQIIKDIAGKQVGRVPANLCGAFRRVLDEGEANISCHYLGITQRSQAPPAHQSYQRGKRFDRQGGGAVCLCRYDVMVPRGRRVSVLNIIQDAIDKMQGDNFILKDD